MKKQPLLVTKIISSLAGEISSLTVPSQAGILPAPIFSNSKFFLLFFFFCKAGQRPHINGEGGRLKGSTPSNG